MVPPVQTYGHQRLRILVVDDYEDAAWSLSLLLSLHGHEVTIARDGAQAIAAALHERPHFILLEISLPGVNGYQVAATLRQQASCKDTVIIAVSVHGGPEDRRRSREAGIDHHLLKPVESGVLVELISRPDSRVRLATSGQD